MPSETLLVEVGCEEIPARLCEPLAREFAANLHRGLVEARLVGEQIKVTVAWTPRRLIAIQPGVATAQPVGEEELIGPPVRVAFGSDGAPTPQGLGFAAKSGAGAADLYRVTTPKGEYAAIKKRIGGVAAAALLSELIPKALLDIKLPRSMRWDASVVRFIRPVRWVVALLGSEPVTCRVGEVEAGTQSQGHRALGKAFTVGSAADFPARWVEQGVIPEPAKRERMIIEAAGPDIRQDPGLLDTLVNLTEYPDVVRGSFDPASLTSLPGEVLVTVMRDHQKYFAVETAPGKLAAQFVAVINQRGDPQGLIRRGNERVLRARFADAQFFYDADRKLSLGERLALLENVTFQARLGSYRQKSLRTKRLAGWLAGQWPGCDVAAAETAAELAKCDLTTEMVKEFTELQGVMGGYYARASGLGEPVAQAIADQYAWEMAPRSDVGAAVAIADKIDTITGMFAIGEAPSGSADPFGLRRQGNGLIRALVERKLRLSLSEATREAHAGYSGLPMPAVSEFFKERLSFYLREARGFAPAQVAAVLAVGADDALDAEARCDALAGVADAPAVAAVIKRARNIVRKENWTRSDLDPVRLKEPSELALHQAVASLPSGGDYAGELTAIADLAAPLERFFNELRVNDDDAAIRANRLSLLAWTVAQLSRVADFSELATN